MDLGGLTRRRSGSHDPIFASLPIGHEPHTCVTPSGSCGLGRAPDAATPALPSRRKRLSRRAKRLRFERHREVLQGQNIPHHCRSQGCSARLAQPQKTAPEGEDAGTGPADLSGSERNQIMAIKNAAKTTKTLAPRPQTARQSITLELVVAHAPHQGLIDNLSRTFGLDAPDYAAIREGTEENTVRSANLLCDDLNEKAMQIHLQRIVGASVSSAYGAAMFYGNKVSEARTLTSASSNDSRDEDREGVAGFESKADRARMFAATMAMQSFALLAAAEGAVHGYAHITGETWKPYEAPQAAPASTQRRSAAAELDAFGN